MRSKPLSTGTRHGPDLRWGVRRLGGNLGGSQAIREIPRFPDPGSAVERVFPLPAARSPSRAHPVGPCPPGENAPRSYRDGGPSDEGGPRSLSHHLPMIDRVRRAATGWARVRVAGPRCRQDRGPAPSIAIGPTGCDWDRQARRGMNAHRAGTDRVRYGRRPRARRLGSVGRPEGGGRTRAGYSAPRSARRHRAGLTIGPARDPPHHSGAVAARSVERHKGTARSPGRIHARRAPIVAPVSRSQGLRKGRTGDNTRKARQAVRRRSRGQCGERRPNGPPASPRRPPG